MLEKHGAVIQKPGAQGVCACCEMDPKIPIRPGGKGKGLAAIFVRRIGVLMHLLPKLLRNGFQLYFTEIRFVWMWAQTTVPPSKSNHPNQESIIKPRGFANAGRDHGANQRRAGRAPPPGGPSPRR